VGLAILPALPKLLLQPEEKTGDVGGESSSKQELFMGS